MKKKFLSLLLGAALVTSAALAGCGQANKSDKAASTNNVSKNEGLSEEEAWKKEPAYGKPIKVGYNGGLCLGAFGIAAEKGFYKEEGLDVKIVKMQSQTDALGTGQVDVAGDHIATLLVPAVNGVKAVFTTGCHTGCKSLYVLSKSGIKSTSDLIGKTIAVGDGIGASDHNISLRFLNHDKVDPNKVKFKPVKSSAVILSMQKGEVQAATLSDQFAKKFVDDGTLKVIRSLTFDKDFKDETCCVHAVNSDFYEKNPITVKKLTRAHKKASKWIEKNKKEFVKIMLDKKWASGNYDLVLDIANTYNFDVSDDITEATLRKIIDDYKTFGLIDKNKDTDEIMKNLWHKVLSDK
ncbi:ABC transporter substrate-binding protein [Clostridium sporogenes]|uniref:ABC transporter substrate-binding protein n=1 Tax=Clostridium sp. LCP25S3_F8 TaxID=3438751 RepID=UPI0013D332EB|nr:ABC transporter substrate-binding protein [Clostridium sporogenes]NFS24653.1 ABC transporter substrate-binding protein [Clostridium sporogenes]